MQNGSKQKKERKGTITTETSVKTVKINTKFGQNLKLNQHSRSVVEYPLKCECNKKSVN